MKPIRSRPLLLIRHLVRSVEQQGLRRTFAESYHRLAASLDSRGLKGSLKSAVHEAPAAIAPAELAHPFDLLHGTDTGGYLAGAARPEFSFSSLYANGYIGIAPSALVQAIAHLPIQPEEFTFVDLGCGKGRALMIAAQFAFRQILGVELDPELSEVAQANIAAYPAWAARISVLNQDATTVTLPDGPLLIFLFNPFLAPVLRRVLANLDHQLRRAPREAWLLYGDNPRYERVLDRFPSLREISEVSYPLSAEDAAAGDNESQQFTLYSYSLPSASLPSPLRRRP